MIFNERFPLYRWITVSSLLCDDVLLVLNLQFVPVLPLECMLHVVAFVTNLQEVSIFAARVCVDGVYSCLFFYSNLKSRFLT